MKFDKISDILIIMKKIFILLLIIFSLTMSFAASAVRVDFGYENPERELIITHPSVRSRETVSSRMSVLGATDPLYPLYINGEEISLTRNGFFTYYAELNVGENVLNFTNGGNKEEITILRHEAAQSVPLGTIEFNPPIFGATDYDYISRFSDFDDDRKARTPLVRRTTFKIIGERGDDYILHDGTMVFKSNVFLLDRELPPITVSGGVATPTDNGVAITFDVNEYPLYDIELDGKTAILRIYTDNEQSFLQPDGEYLLDIEKYVMSTTPTSTALIYNLTFNRPLIGYTVNFAEGVMTVEFRYPPQSFSQAVVMLDAGHGGTDPGALGPPGPLGPMEKHFNLHVWEVAKNYLESLGVTVISPRTDDTFISIADRVEHFTKYIPHLSVAVHTNSMPLTSDFGSETGPLMYYTLDTSRNAADFMIEIIARETGNDYVPAKRRNFALARYTGGPAMLFEMGFLCNPEEYEILLDPDYLDRMGLALGRAVEEYLLASADGVIVRPVIQEPYDDLQHPEEEDFYNREEPYIPAYAQRQSRDLSFKGAMTLYTSFLTGTIVIGAALLLPNRRKLIP